MRRSSFSQACLAGGLLLLVSGCDMDISNPNAPTDEQVLTTAEGLKSVAIGMQGRLGSSIQEAVLIPGLVSGEIGTTNATPSTQREFQDFPDPGANAQIEETNGMLENLWTKHYGVIKSANDILLNVDAVTLDPGTRSGMIALARLAKAMAFGTLIENFQQIPLEPEASSTPSFASRAAVLEEVLSLLAAARTGLASAPPSAEFNNSILANGFDLTATISAMQARYSLLAGAHQQASEFADQVPADASSVLVFSSAVPNPLKVQILNLNYYRPLSSFRSDAEEGDQRVDRFTTPDVITGFGGATLNGVNIYLTDDEPFPVFTQDELSLIRAEAHARLDNLPSAIVDVDAVRGRAGLGGTDAQSQAEVLDEIFRQRTYALFLTGLHWGDLRRFDRIGQAKVAWLPYPFSERVTNPNTPANP